MLINSLIEWMIDEIIAGNLEKAKRIEKVLKKLRKQNKR